MQREHIHLPRLQWAACEDVMTESRCCCETSRNESGRLILVARTSCPHMTTCKQSSIEPEQKRKRDVDYCSRADLTDAFNDAFCHRNIFKCTYVNVHAKALTKTYTITHNSFPAPARANACRNAEVYDHHWAFALFITKVQLEAYLHGQHKYTHSLLHIYKHAYAYPLAVIYIDRK